MRSTTLKRLWGTVLAGVIVFAADRAHAWDPPDGPAAPDQAYSPATPTTLLPKAHGYITQNGITILDNDGYWAAAHTLRQWQQELLNGVRYADQYQGNQCVTLEVCTLLGSVCDTLEEKCWPYAADNHYFNPDTGNGFDTGSFGTLAFWAPLAASILQVPIESIVSLEAHVNPPLASSYPSALSWLDTEFANAVLAFQGGSPLSISGRSGVQLAMFYLGWASHFMQDQNVVHHTYDEFLKHHSEYEAWADADTSTSPPTWNRAFTSPPVPVGLSGIYDVPTQYCNPGAASCFGSYAALTSHVSSTLSNADATAGQDTAAVQAAVKMAERLQAGLYAKFFTAVGQPPINMPGVVAAIYAQ